MSTCVAETQGIHKQEELPYHDYRNKKMIVKMSNTTKTSASFIYINKKI